MTPAELRRIAQAATEGPWAYRGDYFGVRQVPTDQHLVGPNKYEMEGIVPGEHIRPEDAEFIATFNPQKVLELLDENQRLSQRVTRLSNLERRNAKQRDEARARLAAVEKLHAPGNIVDVWGKSRTMADDFQVCRECTDPDNNWVAWPCDTIKAVRGE